MEPENHSQTTKGEEESHNTVDSSVAEDESVEEDKAGLTLVLLGDPDAVETDSNFLLDPDKEKNQQFSSSLYDLCGRVISVINLLDLQNIEQFPSNKGVHAFLLLLPHGQHVSQYKSGVQWLEASFGKGALAYLMTVVTHEWNEKCERALTDLKTIRGFAEKRYHTCRKSMRDEAEILVLLEKIDAMVSENDPQCYIRTQSDGQEGEEETKDSSLQNQTAPPEEATEIMVKTDGKNDNRAKLWDSAIHSADKNGDLYVEMIKEKDGTMKQNHNTEALLKKLQLQHKYEDKLTSAEILQLGPPLKHDQNICESDLSSIYLQRMMMLDYRARYIQLKYKSFDDGLLRNTNVSKVEQQQTNKKQALKAFYSSSVDSIDQSHQTNIHPLDVQMAVFHCSDSFLKQTMVTKLSQCQYALPLLVPDPVTMDIECPLWTFRQIKKTWKKTETKEGSKVVTMKSMPVCKAETPMVLSFRLGSLSVSKSQLMNTLINDRHSTFFHRNCLSSTKTHLLFDGVAEIAWYCPAGKPNDTFNDCVAFCNLHGDGLTYETQLNILMDKSSVNVVLMPTLINDKTTAIIEDLFESPTPLIVLIEDIGVNAVEIIEQKYKGLKDRSQSDVSEELKRIIRETLSGPHKSFQLESMSEAGIRVDEDDTHCRSGLSAAMKMMETIKTVNVYSIKSMFLPCQGQLWHDWCRINKEQYRLKGHVEMERSKKQNELQKLREDQCNASCSDLMKSFINPLSSLPSTEREYFLKWTQILLDAHATDYLSSVLQRYDQKWSEVLDLKKKPDKSKELKIKQAELAELSKNLQSATCGLEHIFREMGQIYEANKTLQKPPKEEQTDWSKYPELAAELMISGHPMELMDGDAAHVPSTWISSLIDEVKKKLGNKRVFVLSVLGIQSSGKSTMLNAMFGLQFAVSAGRCTRGAFMQLVKLSEDIKTTCGTQWDYILVVDTEGLRALELEGNTTIHHDNELATFVVGLGNMTLVNIFGENPSEMQDVLQIVVQAFMRMKKVRLSPSCVFVHQNVTDVGAVEKNLDGKRKLQDKLDQMVQLAAKEEGSEADSFSDVIEFDVQKDVKYFAQLWEGSPPMAPPNPGYSESVQDLKSFILSKASKSPGVTLFEFKTKVEDLWKALVNENFVFSFKNTLEITVYRKLEVEFGKWTWALRKEMLTIEEQLYTKIENGSLEQIDPNYLYREISKKYDEITNSIILYFDSENDQEMLVQWRGRFEQKIKDFQDDLVRVLHKKLSDVIEQKKTGKKLDEKKTMFEDKLLQKSKELAHQLKDKAKDEHELKKQFNCVWEGWVTELTEGTKPIEKINLEHDESQVLQEVGFEWKLIEECKRSNIYKDIFMFGDYSDYVGSKKEKDDWWALTKALDHTKKKVVRFLKGRLPQEEQQKITDLIQTVENQSLELIRSKPVATSGYSSSYLSELALNVITNVGDFESKGKYFLKKKFTVDLSLYVFNRTERWLSESHEQFIKNTDARTYLESKKGEYYNAFRSFCKGSPSAVVLAELICEKLKTSMTEAVCNRTAINIAGKMRDNFPAFKENRLNLEKHVLTSLAKKEDFERYITYINDPKKYIESFITEEVNEYIKTEQSVPFMLKKNIEEMKTLVSQALFQATDKVQEGDIDKWLQEFDSLLKDKLTFDSVSSQNFKDVNRFDFLKDAIEKGLVPIIKELERLPLNKMKFRQQPDQILIDQLCDCCWEKCPFCAAVCTDTVKDHSPDKHSVPFHRPSGIKGWHFRGTMELVIDFCTTLVASDRSFYPHHNSDVSVPYKQYQTAGEKYAAWLITPAGSKLIYWKWFIRRFQKELEDYHKLKFVGRGEIPPDWRHYTKDEAIKSLDEMYNI